MKSNSKFLEYSIVKTCILVLFLVVPSNVLSLNIARQCEYPAIFNFGDSNSDTGGLSTLFGRPVYDPNGETFFNGSAGRLCDGRLVIDFLAERLGIAKVNPYLKSVGSNFSQGANFATGVYTQGGRSFLIHNIGPLGCLPSMLTDYPVIAEQKDDFGCAISINEAAQFYNAKLKDAVDQLKKDLPLARITYVDVYSIKYTIITQPKQFGFEEGIVACCGIGGKYNYDPIMKCGYAKKVNGEMITIAKSCKNPSFKVNWDGIHFTEAANKILFQQSFLPFCAPTSFKM